MITTPQTIDVNRTLLWLVYGCRSIAVSELRDAGYNEHAIKLAIRIARKLHAHRVAAARK